MNHFAYWKANVWNNPAARNDWIQRNVKALLEFTRNFIAGTSLYVLSLAIYDYTHCGSGIWRPAVASFLIIASALVVGSAYVNWAMSFSWPAIRRITLYLGLAVGLASLYTVVDFKLWSEDGKATTPHFCSGKTLWDVLAYGWNEPRT